MVDLDNKKYQTSYNQEPQNSSSLNFSTSYNQPEAPINFFQPQQQVLVRNIVIPYVEIIKDSETTREGKYTGLTVKGAFQL